MSEQPEWDASPPPTLPFESYCALPYQFRSFSFLFFSFLYCCCCCFSFVAAAASNRVVIAVAAAAAAGWICVCVCVGECAVVVVVLGFATEWAQQCSAFAAVQYNRIESSVGSSTYVPPLFCGGASSLTTTTTIIIIIRFLLLLLDSVHFRPKVMQCSAVLRYFCCCNVRLLGSTPYNATRLRLGLCSPLFFLLLLQFDKS